MAKPRPVSGVTAPVSNALTEPATVVVERGADGRKIYRINSEFVIEGRIQKPTAFLVFSRENINYEWSKLKAGFLYQIEESVKDKPF